jgi:hypothetical protein
MRFLADENLLGRKPTRIRMSANVFISYSHADEKALERLLKHLAMLKRDGKLEAWSDHKIMPGTPFDQEIISRLNESNIFLAMLSQDYLSSNYCYEKEFEQAMQLTEEGRIRIVPIILEPCDWLASPFRQFAALPKEGQAISLWTNQNVAFLDVVAGLRRVLDALTEEYPIDRKGRSDPKGHTGRWPRVKRDFDFIQKSDFADKTYETIKEYFRTSCDELSRIDDDLKAKFEVISGTAFTCTVVNRALGSSGEAHITVHNMKQRSHFGGDINYIYQRHADPDTSNGHISVEADDLNIYLVMDVFHHSRSREAKYKPEQVADLIWNEFVKHAGIEYE